MNTINHVESTKRDFSFIDLGLSVKWATCNVGATSPEEYGNYYSWGEVVPKSEYTKENYALYDLKDQSYTDIGSNISGSSFDAAHVEWGERWRMPTANEMTELCKNCTIERASLNGIVGAKVIGPNGNSIFLPMTGSRYERELRFRSRFGCYWTGSLDEHDFRRANGLFCDREKWVQDQFYRFEGLSIRPVTD